MVIIVLAREVKMEMVEMMRLIVAKVQVVVVVFILMEKTILVMVPHMDMLF